MSTFAFVGALAVAAFIVLEVWGRRPVWTALNDMRKLNLGLVMLVRQGEVGAALTVNWPARDVSFVIIKRRTKAEGIALELARITAVDDRPTVPNRSVPVVVTEFVGELRHSAHLSPTVRSVRMALEAEAQPLGVELLQGARIQLRSVLYRNVPQVTGVPGG